ncbi:hypothetical protein U1E44_09595 [Arenibacter sp. GZD96]|uniref:DUF6913 domain-containing protein n=1 Tax=Aurantibrevibacter litoralis TaxID=3106030 RepID=UPI002AFF6170|nr:hypothetical protein [Arenibacter sp. GZD-96]MEA1786343.1 hypothetical protein [Arenibacter sp. GZD-96]
MFFKGLKDKFKRKAGYKVLVKQLNHPLVSQKQKSGVQSIGCIVDLDAFSDANHFYELVEEFALRPNAIKIMGYKRYYDKNSPYATPVFSDKDLGWGGQIENSYALEFLSREYDLLINYYNTDNLLLQLLSVKTSARIKIGFPDVDKNLNDLILATPLSDFKLFKKELKKYLVVLKEI